MKYSPIQHHLRQNYFLNSSYSFFIADNNPAHLLQAFFELSKNVEQRHVVINNILLYYLFKYGVKVYLAQYAHLLLAQMACFEHILHVPCNKMYTALA